MCFSATASFVAGASLSAIGVATVRQARSRSELPFALIPLLFGIQQLTEGVVWLTFTRDAPMLRQAMTYIYSGFSHTLWPIYVPFAVGLMESARRRRTLIAVLQAAGVAVGLYLLYFIVTRPVVAEVIGRHIVYVSPHFYLPLVLALYLAATCVTFLVSSHRFMNLFGALALLSFGVAALIHARALVSVWCYFAAVLSVLMYVHLRFRGLGGFPREAAPALATEAPATSDAARTGPG